MKTSLTSRYAILLLAAVLAIAAVACSSASMDTGGDSPATAAPAAQPESPAPQTAALEQSPAATEPAATGSAAATPAEPQAESQSPTAAPPAPVKAETAPSDPAPTPDIEPTGNIGGRVGDEAPDFIGIDNWINSEPISILNERGKVVLVDVWTYTCVNCIRTFPFLREWNDRYADDGLLIVGLHAPEFEFEKDYDNVVQASLEHDIVWPVAQDNGMHTWGAYNNRYWPAKYLIDKDGIVRYTHFGEGAYAETEEQIRKLLLEAGADLSDDTGTLPEDQSRDATFQSMADAKDPTLEVTPELYAGYGRNFNRLQYRREPYVIQNEFFKNPDGVGMFEAPAAGERAPHKIYLNGDWFIGPESVKHARATEDYEDYIAIVYSARSVNAVITSDSGESYRVRVTMDGEYLTEENKGADVIIDDSGESYILVDEPRLYALVDNPEYVKRKELRLSPNSDDFGLFAYTFGVYDGGI